MPKTLGKNRLTAILLLLMSILFIQNVSSAYASDDDDNYNFSWLDPDKKIYVLQNRKYRKAEKLQIFVLGGIGLGETYRTAYQFQPRMGYWFNEDFGIEAFYNLRWNNQNNAYRALVQATGSTAATPLIREVDNEVGVLFNWAPWYAKINVFNTVLYFDWYFSLGAGSMSTQIGPRTPSDPVYGSQWQTQNLFAVYLGTGQLFHLSDTFSLRLDLLGHFYSAPIYGGLAGAPTDKSIFSSFSFDTGIGIKL
jgi:outer membrane beta-barrel protein